MIKSKLNEVVILKIEEIISMVDHTLLLQNATKEQIKNLCDEAITFGCASVCIPPSFVDYAREYINGRIPVCTVIGFPNGYSTTAAKCFEAQDAVKNGADEIDMVINIGYVKDGYYDKILDEINQVKDSCDGRILKVIIETCLLTKEEKIRLCEIVSESDADFIKTSTGFSASGATKEDIELFASNISADKGIKAAGGIATIADAEDFIKLGASRLGTSRIVKLIKNSIISNEY